MDAFRERSKVFLLQLNYSWNRSKRMFIKDLYDALVWNIYFCEWYYVVRKDLKYSIKYDIDENTVDFIEIFQKDINMIRSIVSPRDFIRYKGYFEHGERCFGLRYKGNLVSFLFWSENPPLALEGMYELKKGEFTWSELYTHHLYRGRGFAQQLSSLLDIYMEEQGYRYAFHIFLKNFKPSLNLHRKLQGTTVIGEFKYQRILGVLHRHLQFHPNPYPL